MIDFTYRLYKSLLEQLSISGNHVFTSLVDYLILRKENSIILRHDVDRSPGQSLIFAKAQKDLGITGVYYFRIAKESFNPKLIEEIASYGNEIGYHYEDISLISKTNYQSWKNQKAGYEKDLVDRAIESFDKNLKKFRKIIPVKTICMHGSPISRWDNRLLWKYYKYSDWDILAEPYFDIDLSKFLYLTDTGRRWDGDNVNIRDKPSYQSFPNWVTQPIDNSAMNMSPTAERFQKRYRFHSTSDIREASKNSLLPNNIIMTFHPQRWTDNPILWIQELLMQKVKNSGKYILTKIRK